MAGQPPPAEQHLKDEYGDTSQKNEMFKIVDQHYGQHCKASQCIHDIYPWPAC